MSHHLVLGGARSGKSRFAEEACLANQGQAVYVATAEADDDEMENRIAHHRQQRDARWRLIEEPLDLAGVITALSEKDGPTSILIDCLTLWLSNCLHQGDWQQAKEAFIASLRQCSHPVTLVSNEVGNGVVPMGELSRRFVDEAGWLHQELAQLCPRVTLVVAGIPQAIKQ